MNVFQNEWMCNETYTSNIYFCPLKDIPAFRRVWLFAEHWKDLEVGMWSPRNPFTERIEKFVHKIGRYQMMSAHLTNHWPDN